MKEYDLETFLKKYSNTKVDFFRFNGNYGDSLIWHGTMRLLDRLSIGVNYVDIDSCIDSSILFIDGGGNFVDYYSDVRDFLSLKHKKYKEVVILPHTISGEKQKEFLKELDSNVTIFCREEESFNFVKDNSARVQCYLSQDCAFYNDLSGYEKVGTGTLNAFRDDSESTFDKKPIDNIDISHDGWCKKPLGDFLEKISDYDEIRTDRLHVAIAGTLLNKKVMLFPNSYYKNLSVYEYSLKKYPNTVFVYVKDIDLATYKNIDAVFNDYLKSRKYFQNSHSLFDLFREIVKINYEIWNLEDKARNSSSSFKEVSETKKKIDTCNQSRNDTIRKLDLNFAYLFNNDDLSVSQFVSESPATLIDGLSIFYIRKHMISKILGCIENDTVLIKLYEQKHQLISEQIKFLGKYFDIFISGLKDKKMFFKVFNPVKIYNDPRIRKYIDKLQNDSC